MLIIIGVLASVTTGVQVALQVWNVWRVPDPVGVSPLTWVLALVQSIGLLLLSIHGRYVAAVGINAFVLVGASVILLRLIRGGSFATSIALASAAIALTVLAVVVIAITAGPAIAGDVGAAASAIVWVPQAVRSVRLRSPVGLSWAFVIAGILSSGLWVAYAALVGEWRLAVPSVAAIVALGVTGARALRHSQRRLGHSVPRQL